MNDPAASGGVSGNAFLSASMVLVSSSSEKQTPRFARGDNSSCHSERSEESAVAVDVITGFTSSRRKRRGIGTATTKLLFAASGGECTQRDSRRLPNGGGCR